MASQKDSTSIEKLNSGNYTNWQFKVQMLLIRDELIEVITEEAPTPLTDAWTKKDRKARALINLSIDDNQIVHVKNLTSAKQTWDALKQIHERSNLSSKLHLLRKLYSTKLNEGGNMTAHITKILELVDKLSAIGENISDSHISALLLCSLPPSYDTLVTALEARDETELTVQFIKSKLTDEYTRRIDNSENSENSNKAYKAQGKFNNSEQKRGNNKYCSHCRMRNHSNKDCWFLKTKNNNSHTNNRHYKNKNNSTSLVYEENNIHKSAEPEERKHVNNSVALLTEESENKGTFIVDSGSSSHIVNSKDLFTNITNNSETNVTVANGNKMISYGSGEVVIHSENKNKQIILRDVLYVPDIEANLLSVSRATKNGCKVKFDKDKCNIIHEGNIILQGKLRNNLYEIHVSKDENYRHYANVTYNCSNANCIDLWHRRMGHRSYETIKSMLSKDLVGGIKINNCKHNAKCEVCITSKFSETPFPKSGAYRATKRLELVHSDVCGPINTPTIGGKRYFITFIDDYTRFCVIYLMANKSEASEKLKEYVSMVKNKFGKMPTEIRSDNGGEYTSNEIEKYLKENGIHHQLTVPFNPSQNGVAERKNRSLLDMVRSMLNEANLPHKLWGEAICTANHLQNRLPSKSVSTTPYELWMNRKPNLKYLKVFGCTAYAYIHKSKRGKLDNRAEKGTFVGYDSRSKAYRIYTSDGRVILARSVKFIENKNNSDTKEYVDRRELIAETNKHTEQQDRNEIEIDLTPTQNELSPPPASQQQIPQVRRSERTNRGVPPDRFAYAVRHDPVYVPNSWEDMMNIENPIEKQNWIKATEEEINSLNENQTWSLVDPPQGARVIGSKWTFKAKYDELGKVKRYKARLVAQGFRQKYGVDFDETYAPVVSHTSLRVFITAAAYHNLNIRHIDIKTAFLHGELEENVYVSQPKGYINTREPNKVCKLKKALYGLKQAARAWYSNISETLKTLKFKQSDADNCLFIRKEGENTIYIAVYVDDILIAGKDEDINDIIKKLKSKYALEDLGQISNYLGIKIQKTHNGFKLNQTAKIIEIAKRFNLEDSKPYGTPMETSFQQLDSEEKQMPNNTKYRQAIGALLYVATISRPDILVAVNILSRKNETPSERDWKGVKRLIRYLYSTKDLNLVISTEEPPILEVYCDADWGGDLKTRRSTTGNLFLLGKNPIEWVTKRQTCVAQSSAEAEFVAAASATQELMWLLKLLEDLDIKQKLPIVIHEDNKSCIKMIESEKFSNRTKHIDIKYNVIKQLKEDKIIELRYCASKSMTADILTKPEPKPEFLNNRNKLKLQNNPD